MNYDIWPKVSKGLSQPTDLFQSPHGDLLQESQPWTSVSRCPRCLSPRRWVASDYMVMVPFWWWYYTDLLFVYSVCVYNMYILPIGSMYAIYGNIYHQYIPNVSIYTIHGSYGLYIYICILVGGDWNHGILNDFPFSWGMSSSQLTNSIIFQRGRYTTNQIYMIMS